MRGRLPLLAAILAASLFATTAGAASTGSKAPARSARAALASEGVAMVRHPAAHLQRSDLRSPAAVVAVERRIVRDRIARTALSGDGGQACFGCYGPDLNSIDDVDHDGVGDILEARFDEQPQLIVHSGRTGRVLWRLADPNLIFATYLRLPGGKGRILAVTAGATETDTPAAGVADVTLTLTARDAATGAASWTVPLDGTVEYDVVNELVVQFPELDGVLNRANASPLLLLDRANAQFGLAENVFTMQPLTIDAATGSTVTNGAPVASDGFAYAMPIRDVTADGTDDYVTGVWGDGAVATVVDGATAQPVWATSPSPDVNGISFAATSPDIDGDATPDVLVGMVGNAVQVHALSGPTGSAIWTTDGEYAEPVGDADRDHRSDTRIYTFGPDRQGFSLVDARGRTRWTRTMSVNEDYAQWTFGVGDVDGDHVADIYLRVLTRQQVDQQAAGLESAIISGRDGHVTTTTDLGWPVSMPDGRTKFVRAVRTKAGMTLSVYDARSNRAQWVTTVASSGAQRLAAWTVASARHRSLLVAMIQGIQQNVLVAADSATGQAKWRQADGRGGPVIIK